MFLIVTKRNLACSIIPVLWIVVFSSWATPLFAQLTVVQGSAMNMTPEELVQNYIVGQGITISNATYNGSSALITSVQTGTFATAGVATMQLGLTGGVLMTSGMANYAIGPNNSPSKGYAAGGPGDPDLNILSNSTTHDKAVIEFDFIPQYDTVRFRYVFGSEEFYEYCNQFNDAFGFFLSGPGINGTFSNNAVNIAIMPGSLNTPVTINNICANPATNWNNNGGTYYQYDGLTHVFTAFRIVTPCLTYHIKLAVADAVDNVYDSGVFLEKNSFSSPGITMVNGGTVPPLGNVAYEGCNDVSVGFKLSTLLDYAVSVNYFITGTAINGTDYTQIPDYVIIPAGQDSASITIHPIVDNIPEGTKTVILTLDQITCNGEPARDTVWIKDYTFMTLKPIRDTTVCQGATVQLKADITGGMEPFTFNWSISPLNDSIITIVPPVGNNLVTLDVHDICTNDVSNTSHILVNPTPLADAGSNMTIPNGTSTTLHGNASGGSGSYGFLWTSVPPGFTSTQQNPSTGNLSLTTIFSLEVTDIQTGCISDPAQVIIAVQGGPLSENPVAIPDIICYGMPTQLYALAGGGSGLYTYTWSSVPAGFSSTLQDPAVTPLENTSYYLSVNDGFNIVTGNTSVSVNPLPVVHLGPSDSTVCVYETVVLDAGNPGSSYRWSNGDTSRTITIASTGIGEEVQTYKVWVTNANSCVDSATINVYFSFSACTGVSDTKGQPEFYIYPNPAEGSVSVVIDPAHPPVLFEVYSVYGSKVMSVELNGGQGSRLQQVVDISSLSRGLYILKVSGSDLSASRKLLVR